MSKAGKKWTDEDLTILKNMYANDDALEAMSTKLGRNSGGIRAKLDQLGLYEKIDQDIETSITADLTLLLKKYNIDQINTVLQKLRTTILPKTNVVSSVAPSVPQLGVAPSTAPSTAPVPIPTLSKEELLPLTAGQALAFDYFLDRKSFCLTGPAGTGKSYIIKHIRDFCRDNDVPYAITALTGVAASLIGGQTLHKWAGLGLMNKSIETLVAMIKHNATTLERWTKIEVLVIDETSMMNQAMFEMLHVIACKVRENVAFYGGIQVIFCCDFAQLAPIEGNYVFESPLWLQELADSTVYLNEVLRQDNPDFIQMLTEIRLGKMTSKSKMALNARLKQSTDSMIQPTVLYPHKKTVDDTNNRKLDALPYEKHIYTAKDTIYNPSTKKTHNAMAKDMDTIEERCPKNLALCEQAQVMLTVNIDTEHGLVNGSRGVIVGFVSGNPEVLFDNGAKVVITPVSFESQTQTQTARRVQVPLILAWATTIHKCQGSTLTHAITDLREIFCSAQGYVTLSRLRSLEGLYLIGIDFNKFNCDPRVLAYYEGLSMNKPYTATKPTIHAVEEEITLSDCLL